MKIKIFVEYFPVTGKNIIIVFFLKINNKTLICRIGFPRTGVFSGTICQKILVLIILCVCIISQILLLFLKITIMIYSLFSMINF